jgi:hypothetical protein
LILDVGCGDGCFWKRVWNKYRFADRDTGRHLIVYLCKSDKR